jgi:hypothetical protein
MEFTQVTNAKQSYFKHNVRECTQKYGMKKALPNILKQGSKQGFEGIILHIG